MSLKNVHTALILFLLIWSSAGSGATPYTLGAGDVVRISVYGQPDLTTVQRIAANGTIAFPLVGELPVAGLTEREAERELAARLERKQIVRSAQVTFLVEQYESQRVSVLGNVAKPGVYPIVTDSTLIDLIAEAGGLTDEAGGIAILTKGSGGAADRVVVDLAAMLEKSPAGQDIQVADGDRIFIPRMDRFYIYGQVNRPNVYRLEQGMTVMQAISVAGGLTDKGTERGLTIKRGSPAGEGAVSIAGELTEAVQANDVIYVKESLF